MDYPLGIIPARAGSTRFPNKPLAKILKKPMIQYVWEAASRSQKLSEVVIATDCKEIQRAAEGFGAMAILTPKNCETGTERIAWVAREAGGKATDVVLNLQGDEPLLSPKAIDGLVAALESDPKIEMATLAVKKQSESELANSNVVKVVVSQRGEALYFSRSPLKIDATGCFYKHIGIYGFRRASLMRFCSLEKGGLESVESLEQLRALENGMRIKVVEVDSDTIAVDVPDDILEVENYLQTVTKPLGGHLA